MNVWNYALVQRLRCGRVVALRHPQEQEAIKGLRHDAVDGWMFYENSVEKMYPEFLYAVEGRVAYRGLPIEQVPHEVVSMLSPAALVQLA